MATVVLLEECEEKEREEESKEEAEEVECSLLHVHRLPTVVVLQAWCWWCRMDDFVHRSVWWLNGQLDITMTDMEAIN